jgi:hypothetical protein
MILQHSGMTAGYFSTACIYHCGQSYDRVKEIGMLTQEKCAARDWVWSTTFHSFKAVGDESRASSTLPPPPPPPPFTTPVWRKQSLAGQALLCLDCPPFYLNSPLPHDLLTCSVPHHCCWCWCWCWYFLCLSLGWHCGLLHSVLSLCEAFVVATLRLERSA